MTTAEQIDPSWCSSHGRYERYDEPYRQCSECGHTYPTSDALAWDFMHKRRAAPRILRADQIYNCAHCLHDFIEPSASEPERHHP